MPVSGPRRSGALVRYAILVVGGLLLINALAMAIRTNFNVGYLATTLIAAVLIAYGLAWNRVRDWRWLHALVGAGCLALIVFSGFLFSVGHRDNARFDEDAVIVLGAGVHGREISRTLARRLDSAVAYHERNPDAVIVVTGGQGAQEDITEAAAMERYLIQRGVPADRIIKEDRATSTLENFRFSDALLREKFPDGYNAAFITNDFHVYRAGRIASELGVAEQHIGAGIDWYAIPTTYIREIMAVAQNWLTSAARP